MRFISTVLFFLCLSSPAFAQLALTGAGAGSWSVSPSNPPSIDVDFANNRAAINGTVTPATSVVTVSNYTGGYVNDSAGNWILIGPNLPRIGAGNGLLVEESRTNLFLQSATPATQSIAVASGSTYSVSVIGTGSLVLSGALTGTVTQNNPVIGAASTTSLVVTTSGITGPFVNAQVELGASVTSPIRTTTTSATRGADIVSLTTPPTFGTAYSLYVKGIPQTPTSFGTNQGFVCISDSTSSNRVSIRRINTSATYGANISTSGVGQPILSVGAWAQNSLNKAAAAFATNDAQLYGSGAASAHGTPTIPLTGLNAVFIGSDNGIGNGFFADGFVSEIAVWPTQRIPDTQLQALTQ